MAQQPKYIERFGSHSSHSGQMPFEQDDRFKNGKMRPRSKQDNPLAANHYDLLGIIYKMGFDTAYPVKPLYFLTQAGSAQVEVRVS